jgi:molybdenum cofactor biosynthesis protein B
MNCAKGTIRKPPTRRSAHREAGFPSPTLDRRPVRGRCRGDHHSCRRGRGGGPPARPDHHRCSHDERADDRRAHDDGGSDHDGGAHDHDRGPGHDHHRGTHDHDRGTDDHDGGTDDHDGGAHDHDRGAPDDDPRRGPARPAAAAEEVGDDDHHDGEIVDHHYDEDGVRRGRRA